MLSMFLKSNKEANMPKFSEQEGYRRGARESIWKSRGQSSGFVDPCEDLGFFLYVVK